MFPVLVSRLRGGGREGEQEPAGNGKGRKEQVPFQLSLLFIKLLVDLKRKGMKND